MKKFVKEEGVHIRDENTTSKMMKHVLIALIPIILFSFYKNGIMPYLSGDNNFLEMLYPLILVIVGMITSVVIEVLYIRIIKRLKKQKLKTYLKDSHAIFPGLFLGILLPINTPIHLLVLGVVVGTLIGKMIFGGFGKNIFNPALLGYLFLFLIFPMNFTTHSYFNNYELDTISGATPLSALKTLDFVGSYQEVVKPFGDLLNIFIGFKPGSGAEISILLCLLALIYLTFFKVIKTKIPVIYIGSVFAMTAFIGYANNMDVWYPLFSIFTGGLVFGAVFMATDPVTSPVTNVGQIIFALGLGILTVLFRYLMPYPEGVMMSILIMNMFVLLLDKIGAHSSFNYKKILIAISIPLLIGICSTLYLSSTLVSADSTVVDKHFKLISKTNDNKYIYYIVTEKCFHQVKAKITMDKAGVITDILILEHSETYYPQIKDADYLQKIIDNQGDLSKLDTISGATVTTSRLKLMVTNVLLDFKNSGI